MSTSLSRAEKLLRRMLDDQFRDEVEALRRMNEEKWVQENVDVIHAAHLRQAQMYMHHMVSPEVKTALTRHMDSHRRWTNASSAAPASTTNANSSGLTERVLSEVDAAAEANPFWNSRLKRSGESALTAWRKSVEEELTTTTDPLPPTSLTSTDSPAGKP